MTEGSMLVSLVLGAAIPTGVHGVTFVVMRHYLLDDPTKILRANILAFGVHLVIYGGSIVAVVSWVDLRMGVFIFSFVGVFVLLHAAEAVYFRRLLLSRKTR